MWQLPYLISVLMEAGHSSRYILISALGPAYADKILKGFF